MRAGLDAAGINYNRCYDDAQAQPDMAPLRTRWWSGRPKLEQLTDQTTPNDNEKKAIARYHEITQPCRDGLLSDIIDVVPSYVPVYATSFSRADVVYADLITDKITWGEARRRFDEIGNWSDMRRQALSDQIGRDLAVAHESEMANRRAAALALQNYKPITCSTVGSLTTCY